MKKFILLSLILLCFLFLCSNVFSQSGQAKISGYVTCTTCNYQGLKNATIELISIYNDKYFKTKTNKYGSWNIKNFKMGEYYFKVRAKGFLIYNIVLFVPSDSETKLHVRLRKL